MSGVSRPGTTRVVVSGVAPGLVDPTVDLTQPNGPFPYGEAILTDGAGSYTIAPTFRPYFIGFRIPEQVTVGGVIDCEHQGVVTTTSGPVVTLHTNLIGISVSVSAVVRVGHVYEIEIVRDPTGTPVVVAALTIDAEDGRTAFRRDLNVGLPAGVELGARVSQTSGKLDSAFVEGLIIAELEG